jgi:hypothetical protein
VITADRKWPRWCGTRDDLVRAIGIATQLVQDGTGLPVEPEVTVTLADGITDTGHGTAPIDNLHRNELGNVDAVHVSVEVSHDTWWKAREAAREKGQPEPPEPKERISLRLGKVSGVSLEVRAKDRTRAEGLRSRLDQALSLGASERPPFQGWWFLVGVFPAAMIALLLAGPIVRALGLASQNDQWEAAELVAIIAGPLIAAGIPIALWWMFPTLELLDEGGLGRFRRFRAKFFATVGALILALVAAGLYDAIQG